MNNQITNNLKKLKSNQTMNLNDLKWKLMGKKMIYFVALMLTRPKRHINRPLDKQLTKSHQFNHTETTVIQWASGAVDSYSTQTYLTWSYLTYYFNFLVI